MAYTTIDDPEVYFQVVTWNGNAGTNAVTFGGETDMQPDLIWGKDTSGDRHFLADAVRGKTGTGYYLLASNNNESDTSNAPPDGITSIDSNGFTLGANTSNTNGGWSYEINEDKDNGQGNSGKYVAWCWKAGTSFSNDASATSVGSIDSTGSINTTAGFSIIGYTGNATDEATVAHGLSAVPKVIIFKNRSSAEHWRFHTTIVDGSYDLLYPNLTNAKGDSSITAPTSSVFSLDEYTEDNGSGNSIITYCFAPKQGFSKFGSYTGNGDADGTFVFCGFRPAFVMVKRTDSTADWHIQDIKRDTYNPADTSLFADTTDADTTSSTYETDFLSNGFKLRGTTTARNGSGNTYIYMAFAEAPFVNSNGVPCNAR
jgi:hypothetical protein